jgi:hypothetical protein
MPIGGREETGSEWRTVETPRRKVKRVARLATFRLAALPYFRISLRPCLPATVRDSSRKAFSSWVACLINWALHA